MSAKTHSVLVKLVFAGLALCLTGLVATALIEGFPHHIFGISFFVLVVCHLVLNRFWIRHSLSGKWNFHRVFLTGIIVALAILVFTQAILSILLFLHYLNILPEEASVFSSTLHMSVGTWIFVLASIHVGLNANILIGNKLHFQRDKEKQFVWGSHNILVGLLWLVLAAAAIYGIVQFFQLGLPHYMVMMRDVEIVSTQSLVVRYLRFLCVGVAIAGITHWVSLVVQCEELKHIRRLVHAVKTNTTAQ